MLEKNLKVKHVDIIVKKRKRGDRARLYCFAKQTKDRTIPLLLIMNWYFGKQLCDRK